MYFVHQHYLFYRISTKLIWTTFPLRRLIKQNNTYGRNIEVEFAVVRVAYCCKFVAFITHRTKRIKRTLFNKRDTNRNRSRFPLTTSTSPSCTPEAFVLWPLITKTLDQPTSEISPQFTCEIILASCNSE